MQTGRAPEKNLNRKQIQKKNDKPAAKTTFLIASVLLHLHAFQKQCCSAKNIPPLFKTLSSGKLCHRIRNGSESVSDDSCPKQTSKWCSKVKYSFVYGSKRRCDPGSPRPVSAATPPPLCDPHGSSWRAAPCWRGQASRCASMCLVAVLHVPS